MTSSEKARTLLTDGIIIEKDDIIAKGYIKNIQTSNDYGSPSMSHEVDFQCTILFDANVILNSPTDSEYYIVRKKK